MKVLIVEDSPPMLKMIRRAIADWAHEICECGDGAEAVALYAEQLPDWVLMDIELGAVNGIAATRQIKNNFPEARVVMVTNYNDHEMREAATRAGACGYVLKENLLELRRQPATIH
ncbi:MAG: response regulator transcription factor [Pyrinomonadaceae bacterium]|nr:response regulator transcription factor [Pyrinomonadaceae bacterium]